jgi:TPR repeat protein
MSGGVFICYRREDSAGFARLIYDRLTNKLGHDNVFFDVDNIAPGLDFVDILSERVGKCEALVAVIGRSWTSSVDVHNRRRLDDPNDFVRIEIEAALARKVRVIPVLVDGAAMPGRDDLPDSLKKLARRQGIEISHTRFDSDVERLTRALSLLEEELRRREASAEAERAALEERQRRETAEAEEKAEKARQSGERAERERRQAEEAEEPRVTAKAEAARRADEERRERETAEAERLARKEREQRAETEAVGTLETEPSPQAQTRAARTWRAPLLLVGAAACVGALITAWPLFAPFNPPHGSTPVVVSSVSGSQRHEAAATPAAQAASPSPPPPPASQEQRLTPLQEDQMGDRYFYGNGVERDYTTALEWYRKAAGHGSADGQYNIGWLFENGFGVTQDSAQATLWYQKAADQGDGHARAALGRLQSHLTPDEQNEMGGRYFYGRGVEQDYAKAMEWYRKAADQGFADAQFTVGSLYENGWGVAKDIDQARVWYQKAADQAYGPAKTALARLQSRPNPSAQNVPPSPSPMTAPQEQSLTPAEENEMGRRYFVGLGVARDYAKALECYRKAADGGFAEAQYNIGLLYERGLGVAKDLEQAKGWYQKAADRGDAFANAALQRLQSLQNPSEQTASPNSASAATPPQGDPVALRVVGDGYLYSKDYLHAMESYRKAADQGYAPAQADIGVLYENGWGVAKDIDQARVWYQKAADQAYEPAKTALGRLQANAATTAITAQAPQPEKSTTSEAPLTAARERALKPGDSFKECGDCPEIVVLPPGSFMMGSREGEGWGDQRPAHEVTIAKPFAAAKFALTFDEWDACAARGGCRSDVSDSGWGRGRRPAINVSWDDAQAYVKWLSSVTRKPYRLLSEAEYEYAARAGSETTFPWGETFQLGGKPMANCKGCGSEWDGKQTAPVGSFSANAFGLYDMVGNVWEMTEDCSYGSYQGAPTDGSVWMRGDCSHRVMRGGSWNLTPDFLRSAWRGWTTTAGRSSGLGFRVARTLNF